MGSSGVLCSMYPRQRTPTREGMTMNQIDATWANGQFTPDEVVELPERTRVRLIVEPIVGEGDSRKAWESLKTWIEQNPIHGLGRRLTRDELHERR